MVLALSTAALNSDLDSWLLEVKPQHYVENYTVLRNLVATILMTTTIPTIMIL